MLEMAEVEAIQATEEAEAVQEADGEEVQFLKNNKIRPSKDKKLKQDGVRWRGSKSYSNCSRFTIPSTSASRYRSG